MKEIDWLKRIRYIFFGVVGLALMLAAVLSTPVGAQQSTPSDDQVNQIAKQLYCPVCENIPLDVCPTQACAQWRELIRTKLADGWTEQQIKDYFVLQYGDRVLAEPPVRGLNWAVYLLPALGFLTGIFILIGVLRKARKPKPGETPPPPTASPQDPYVKQLEETLKKRD
ncbi:MAG: cytochrome c-type biogenesis protein [Anaerolineaceae bacterium]